MNKQDQFLLIVQCGILAYVKDMDQTVASDMAMEMAEKALRVAPRLPGNISALDAAKELIGCESIPVGQRSKRPDWLE